MPCCACPGMRSKVSLRLFVSDKLDEILQVADWVTVLRDGKKVGTFPKRELDDEKLTHLMTGKKVTYLPFQPLMQADKPVLESPGLSKHGNFKDISFKLFPGEISGADRFIGFRPHRAALSLFGVNQTRFGEDLVDGKTGEISFDPGCHEKTGISYVPETAWCKWDW